MNATLSDALKRLRLSGLAGALDVRLQEAAGNSLNHAEFLELIGDVPSATAILDRFLHHAQVVPMKGRSYRLKDSACKGDKENV